MSKSEFRCLSKKYSDPIVKKISQKKINYFQLNEYEIEKIIYEMKKEIDCNNESIYSSFCPIGETFCENIISCQLKNRDIGEYILEKNDVSLLNNFNYNIISNDQNKKVENIINEEKNKSEVIINLKEWKDLSLMFEEDMMGTSQIKDNLIFDNIFST